MSRRHSPAVAIACALLGTAGVLWHDTSLHTAQAAEAVTSSGDAASSIEAQLAERRLLIPVAGVPQQQLRDTFNEKRGSSAHEAIDIHAPRGTPVVATDDGRVVKLFHSIPGGLTIYQTDAANEVIYYYAHLDRYAEGLREGDSLKRGDVIGYVGSTGNASANAPHLHFAILRLPPGKEWWKGTALNPFPLLHRAP
jgi:murein DD-endopeptidase MepM/ murein hydrolase activator NlpD